MESEEGLRMGSGEHSYLWKRQRLNHLVERLADRSDLKTWVKGCQGTKEGKNYTEQLSQGIWQGMGHPIRIGFLNESSLPGI